MNDNKKFLQTVKPFLLDKVKLIILVNNDNIEPNEIEVAKTLNEFFSNIVRNLEIPEYQVIQSSINIIRRYSQSFPSFYFSVVDKNTVLKEIRKLSVKKVSQDINIPVKVVKENKEFFFKSIFNLMKVFLHHNSLQILILRM